MHLTYCNGVVLISSAMGSVQSQIPETLYVVLRCFSKLAIISEIMAFLKSNVPVFTTKAI